MALLFGSIAKQAGSSFSASPSVVRFVAHLGAPGAGAKAYLGVAFLIEALLLALVAGGQTAAARSEEASGRLENLLVRPISRPSWLAGRVFVTCAVLVASGLVAGVCTWVAAASDHAGVSFPTLLGAGLNIVPPALCVLGNGVLALGVWPRATSFAAYGVLAWSFLVELVGGIVSSNHWLLDTSVFHQMAPSPAVNPNWTSGGLLVVVGAVAGVLGGVAFRRRDLAGE